MEIVVAIFALLLGVAGIIGSIVPGIPGPPLSWVGMLILFICKTGTHAGEPMSLTLLLIFLAVTIIVTILDYTVPAYFTKVTGGSKNGAWGSVLGLFIGLFINPIAMIIGAILGAFLAELIFSKKNAGDSFASALGAFLGFLFGTGIKLISSSLMLYYIVVYAF